MQIESTADRRALLSDDPDLALFAEIPDAVDSDGASEVIIQRNVPCIFSRSYERGESSEGFHPLALIVDEEAVFIRHGYRIMMKGHVWNVAEIQPDGTGFTQFMLKLQGGYLMDTGDPAVQLGLPYALPAPLGLQVSYEDPLDPKVDPDNPRLLYPYTVKTYFDWNAATVPL